MRWFESGMTSGNIDPVANLRYGTYEVEWSRDEFGQPVEKKTFEIIEGLLKSLGCRIIQLNGSFHIQQIQNYQNTSITVFRYAKNYARDTQDPNVNARGVIAFNESLSVQKVLDNNQPIASGVYTQEEGALYRFFGGVDNIQASFFLNNTPQIAFDDFTQVVAPIDTGISVDPANSLPLNIKLTTRVIWNTIQPLPTGQINVTYFVDTRIRTKIYITDGTTDYYLTPSGTWATLDQFHDVFYKNDDFVGPNFSSLLAELRQPNNAIQNITTAPPPIGGNIYLEQDLNVLWSTQTPLNPQLQPNPTFVRTRVDFEYSTSGQTQKVDYFAENPTNNESSIIVDLGEQIIGDQAGSDVFYQSWLFWDGTDFNNYTQDWQINKTGTSQGVLQTLLSETLSLRRKPSARLDVNVLGDYNPIYSVLYDSRNLVFMGGVFDLGVGAWDVTLAEVLYDNGGISVTTSSDTGAPPSLFTSGGSELQQINNRARYRGAYQTSGSQSVIYLPNDIVLADGYLVLANKETTDYPAPIVEGDPFTLIGNNFAPTNTNSNSVITSGHTYIFTNKTFISEILVYPTTVAANWSYRVFILNLSTGSQNIIDNLTLSSGQWNVVKTGDEVYDAGTELLIYLETTNTGGSATYAEDFNFWPTFPPPSGISVTPYLEFNGVAQTPELQTAMGVDIKIQDVTFSPDYDILAYSQFFASGGGGNAVESVNGQTGAVSLSIGDLNNVTTNAPSDGDIIVYRTASGQFVLEQKPQAGTNPAWGDITGTFSQAKQIYSQL